MSGDIQFSWPERKPTDPDTEMAREIVKKAHVVFADIYMRDRIIEDVAQALSLSESRGVKKGMMRAAEIADKHICKPRREEDGPCMCAIVVQCEIEEAIRQQAESEEE